MPRIRWRDFNGGLWVAGGRDNPPANALRRATGVSQLKEGAIRSTRGTRGINQYGANQFVVFDGALFQGRAEDVLRDGVVVNSGFPQSGVLGQVGGLGRLSFLRMPPQPELVDWLFVAGGNNPFKVKADGSSPSKWGIDAPADGMVASTDSATGFTKSISDMDTASDWVRVEGAGANPTDESTITVSSGSVKWAFTQRGTNNYENTGTDFPVNLQHFGTGLSGAPSADQDYIDFYIRLDNPDPDTEDTNVSNFAWMQIAFSLGDDTFDNNTFTRKINGVDGEVSQAGLLDQQSGTGSYALDNSIPETDIVDGGNVFNSAADQRAMLNTIAQTDIMRQGGVWQRVRIPKALFDRTGSDATLGWDDVEACRLTFSRTGKITIYVDTLALTGGFGLQGNYKYLQVFRNSTTGSISNPNPTPVEITGINRGRVALGNIQQPTDPQVDKIDIYRTVGNGEAYFFALTVDVGTILTFDEVVDFRGMFNAPYLTPSDLPDVLQPTQVELDNAPPPSTIFGVLTHPQLARAWWLDSDPANRGNVYYSRTGKPESNLGFVSVTTQTDNPVNALALWNDTIYALTTNSIYRIVGTDEPFVAQEVFGVPGCTAFDTVTTTPFGIVWQATDGVRIFDGSQSVMLGFDALGPLFRGYAAEGLVPFVGTTAAYIREDYFVSNGQDQTLICNLRTQTWRALDFVLRTLYASDDDVTLYGAVSFDADSGDPSDPVTFGVEDDAADTSTNYQIQTFSVLAAVDTEAIIQRVFIDIQTPDDDTEVIPTLIYDASEVVLAGLATGGARQTIEYARLDLSRLVAVRLDSTTRLEPIILYGIEMDVTVPEGSGSPAV